MPAALEDVRERLLRAGVDRRFARRYIEELEDHLDELIAEEEASGSPRAEAGQRALARLGAADLLVDAMAARRDFRAWSAREPATAFLVAPTVLLGACTALSAVLIVAFCMILRPEPAGPSDLPGWAAALVAGVAALSNAMLPLLLGWALASSATRQRSPPLWSALGFLTLAAVGAALQIEVTVPRAGIAGEIGLRSLFELPLLAPDGLATRFTLLLMAMATPYVLASRSRRQSSANPIDRSGGAA